MINQRNNNETMDQLIQNFENLTISKKKKFLDRITKFLKK